MYPSESAERVFVRLPNGMRDRIKELAATNRRSMNAEIVHHLEKAIGCSHPEMVGPLHQTETAQ